MDFPIVLLGGPSAVGKNRYGRPFARQHRLARVERDSASEPGDYPFDDRFDLAWNALVDGDASLLASHFQDVARRDGWSGGLLSIRSHDCFSLKSLASFEDAGMVPIVLWATRTDCQRSFAERESILQRGLTLSDWARNNRRIYQRYAYPAFDRFRVITMLNGKSRTDAVVLGEMEALFTRPHAPTLRLGAPDAGGLALAPSST